MAEAQIDGNALIGTTYVSTPGAPSSDTGATSSPGATGPGSNLTPTHGAILIIASSAVALMAIGVIFRRAVGSTK